MSCMELFRMHDLPSAEESVESKRCSSCLTPHWPTRLTSSSTQSLAQLDYHYHTYRCKGCSPVSGEFYHSFHLGASKLFVRSRLIFLFSLMKGLSIFLLRVLLKFFVVPSRSEQKRLHKVSKLLGRNLAIQRDLQFLPKVQYPWDRDVELRSYRTVPE